jgi:hypothetical protein
VDHVLKHETRRLDQLSAADVAVFYNAEDRELDKDTLNTILLWLMKQAHE